MAIKNTRSTCLLQYEAEVADDETRMKRIFDSTDDIASLSDAT